VILTTKHTTKSRVKCIVLRVINEAHYGADHVEVAKALTLGDAVEQKALRWSARPLVIEEGGAPGALRRCADHVETALSSRAACAVSGMRRRTWRPP
jgi:hypothetical protein